MVGRRLSWLGTSALTTRLVVGLLVLLVACSPAPQDREHAVDDGPLSALVPGVQRFDSDRPTKVVTFGAISLCAARPGAPIVLDAVRYQALPAPTVATPWLRTVPDVGERDRGSTFDWRPLLVVAGFPPDHLAEGPWRGLYVKDVKDVVVDQSCFGASDLDARRIELLTALKVGPQGTAVRTIYVDYHVDTADYTLVVPGQQLVCGTKVETGC